MPFGWPGVAGKVIARLNGMMGPRAVTRQVTSSIGTWDGLTP